MARQPVDDQLWEIVQPAATDPAAAAHPGAEAAGRHRPERAKSHSLVFFFFHYLSDVFSRQCEHRLDCVMLPLKY